jgi:hypothetical protein
MCRIRRFVPNPSRYSAYVARKPSGAEDTRCTICYRIRNTYPRSSPSDARKELNLLKLSTG